MNWNTLCYTCIFTFDYLLGVESGGPAAFCVLYLGHSAGFLLPCQPHLGYCGHVVWRDAEAGCSRCRRGSSRKTGQTFTLIISFSSLIILHIIWVSPRSPLLDKLFVYRHGGHRGDLWASPLCLAVFKVDIQMDAPNRWQVLLVNSKLGYILK